MRRNIIIAVVLSLSLSGCATYQGADGHTHVADPPGCGEGVCQLLIIGALAGIAVAVAHSK